MRICITKIFSNKRVIAFIIFCQLLLLIIYLVMKCISSIDKITKCLEVSDNDNFTFGDNIKGYGKFIVPNIVHYVRFGSNYFDFISLITIKSVLINQNPEKIYIHCDCEELYGKYWDKIRGDHRIIVRTIEMPKEMFGKKLSENWLLWHASDVTRLKVLIEFGGIYLDNDVYVFKSFDKFRTFEMSIGWETKPKELIGNQVLVAHKNARFLHMWYESYNKYDSSKWYYNGGELPTQMLESLPGIIHRVEKSFGVSSRYFRLLFDRYYWDESDLHSVHLLIKHRYYLDKQYKQLPQFNEENIKTYPKKFGEMARLMYYGTKDFVD